MNTITLEKIDPIIELDLSILVETIKKLTPNQQFLLVQIILKSLQYHIFNNNDQPKSTQKENVPNIPGWGEVKKLWPEDDLEDFEDFIREIRGHK